MIPVEAPVFAGRVVDVRDHGAVPGGRQLNTAALNAAIDACHRSGGGVVSVPAGTWLTGAIHLLSHVNLRLEEGAVLRFSPRPDDYLPAVFTRWEGVECYNYSPLIYARDAENVGLTGPGVLEGQGEAWWPWKKRQQAAAKTLYDAEHDGVPVAGRVFATEEAALRPQFVQFLACRRVLVEGVTLVDGPMWTIHPVYCEGVVVRGVTVRSRGPNTDGLNPDSCRDVLVEDCLFATGDDCIAINAGMNEDGWRVGRPCENVLIRRCQMIEGHGAITIGSGMSGGVRHIHVHDCRISGGDQGVRLKSMRGRGGVVEDALFENLDMAGLRQEAIVLNMFYGSSTAAARSATPPLFRDIRVRNVTCAGAGAAIDLCGLPEQPMRNVTLEHLHLRARQGIHCRDVEQLALDDVYALVDEAPFLDCANVRGLRASGVTVQQAEGTRQPAAAPVRARP